MASPEPVEDVPDGFAAAQSVADAVLYEGYLLYPYRRSSGKNKVRWQFGVLAPPAWVRAQGPERPSVSGSADSWRQRTECLLEAAPGARVRVRVRYLQPQHRSVQVRGPRGGFTEVDAADVGGERYLTFDEAVPRECDVEVDVDALAAQPHVEVVEQAGGESVEALDDDTRIVRRSLPLSAVVRVSVADAEAPFRLRLLRVEVENAAEDVPAGVPRPEALRRSLVAAHTLIGVRGGSFLSLLDPPAWASVAARRCANLHTFPVLAGEGDSRSVVLSSPIILYDHPEVAPESPGDLFDATEIDEILSLRTLTLTEEEKREARATDPRAAAILDRVEVIPKEVFSRLHGAVRSVRPVEDGTDEPPWWSPEGEAAVSPECDAVLVDGTPVARGSRVRLRPRRSGGDVHDMFLAGRTARVEAVFLDVDDARHLAVVLEDDPGADLHRWYGRYHYFAPEEIEPLDGAPS
ncbi:hypothetical protein [Saccharopolyspora cebuensis]|uniref:Uncharacterized protein n=1 Tax=Saccharopolyspora cebuensis TaxID=418759 RepID=A0ABV4CK42_9PSEU